MQIYSHSTNDTWDDKFLSRSTQFDQELRVLLSVQLCCSLGLNSKRVLPTDWYNTLLNCKKIPRSLIKQYGITIGKNNKNNRIVKMFKPDDSDSLLLISDYYTALNDRKRAAEVWGSPKDIYTNLIGTNPEKIDWSICTALNRWFQFVLHNIGYNIFSHKKYILSNSFDAYCIHSGYLIVINAKKDLEDIRQYLTAKRSNALLETIFFENSSAIKEIEEVAEKYKEISYIGGVIGTKLLYLACISANILINKDYRYISLYYIYG